MNFAQLSEAPGIGDTEVGKLLFHNAHKFDIGQWKCLPEEMVDFGRMLLRDGELRLPFSICIFGADFDALETQYTWPKNMLNNADYREDVEIHWKFKRTDGVPDGTFWTKSIAVQAIDLASFEKLQGAVRESEEVKDAGIKADFAFKIYVRFAEPRGWIFIGSMIMDQGGEGLWLPDDGVSPYPQSVQGHERLEAFFLYSMAHIGCHGVLGSVAALASKSTKQEIVPASAKLNKAREKKGKLPICEYRKVIIGAAADMPKSIAGVSVDGRASPRLHWRRGHYRTLPSNVRVPVAPALVGLSDNGIINKDYAIRLDGQT